jgi:lysozyme
MNYSKRGLKLTEDFEGYRLIAYKDQVGVWTVGYGHTNGVKEGDVISPEQAEQFLQDDIQVCVSWVNQHVPLAVTQGEFDALVDFAFNLGVHAIAGSTLLKYIQEGDFDAAAKEFPKWDKAGGHEVAGLLRRRMAEQAEFDGD